MLNNRIFIAYHSHIGEKASLFCPKDPYSNIAHCFDADMHGLMELKTNPFKLQIVRTECSRESDSPAARILTRTIEHSCDHTPLRFLPLLMPGFVTPRLGSFLCWRSILWAKRLAQQFIPGGSPRCWTKMTKNVFSEVLKWNSCAVDCFQFSPIFNFQTATSNEKMVWKVGASFAKMSSPFVYVSPSLFATVSLVTENAPAWQTPVKKTMCISSATVFCMHRVQFLHQTFCLKRTAYKFCTKKQIKTTGYNFCIKVSHTFLSCLVQGLDTISSECHQRLSWKVPQLESDQRLTEKIVIKHCPTKSCHQTPLNLECHQGLPYLDCHQRLSPKNYYKKVSQNSLQMTL